MAELYTVGYGPRYHPRNGIHPASGGSAPRLRPQLFPVVLKNLSPRQTIASPLPLWERARVRAVGVKGARAQEPRHDFTAGLLLVAFQLLLLVLAAGLPLQSP